MLRFSALVCLAATASSLRPMPASALKASHANVQRSKSLVAQVATGWVTGVDQASGATYYFNEHTGESQWEPPAATTTPHQGYGTQLSWILAPSETVLNEYHISPGDVVELGRADMVKPNPYVSRAQCIVHVAPDGTATVESVGKSQTYIFTESEKAPPGEMIDHTVVFGQEKAHVLRTEVLRTGQKHVLQDRDQIVFRQAKFTVYALQPGYEQQFVAQQGGYQLGGMQQNGFEHGGMQQQGVEWGSVQQGGPQHHDNYAQQQQLPYPWEQLVDQNGAAYYHNPQTGESSWDPPQQHVGYPQQSGY